jgi:nicotinamide-nucleotide amidase
MKMVEVPDSALVLENARGLAPGFILEVPGCSVIALPGVPLEMETMMREQVLPFLTKKYGRKARESVLFRLVGLKESDINGTVLSWGFDYSGVFWGMTAEGGVTELYFTKKHGHGFDWSTVTEACRASFGESLLGEGFASPEEELLALLAAGNETVAAAESCTGGLIAKRITDIPGASRSFMGGVVAYDNAVKVRCLGVAEETLRRHGAVSEPTALAMAAGARRAMGTTIALATTGIAGPGGGSEEKPVGTVCFGFDVKGETWAFTRHLGGDRDRIRRIAAVTAIDALRKMLKKQNHTI